MKSAEESNGLTNVYLRPPRVIGELPGAPDLATLIAALSSGTVALTPCGKKLKSVIRILNFQNIIYKVLFKEISKSLKVHARMPILK